MRKTSGDREAAAAAAFRAATRFAPSPLIECCYALAHVCDEQRDGSVHGAWSAAARRRLSPGFWRRFEQIGAWPKVWSVVPDLLQDFDASCSVEALAKRLDAMAPGELATQLVAGILHPLPLVREVVSGKLTLRAAVGKAPALHREWLLFAGLYPFDEAAPVSRMLEQALKAPRSVGQSLVAMLEEFWSAVFYSTWQLARPQYEQSVAQKARLQAGCTPQRLADELRLRVEFNLSKSYLQAVRGGYRLPFSRLGTAWMIPSAFNVHHLWHVLPAHGKQDALFPYFDPSIDIGVAKAADRHGRQADPQIDPALVFRALADTARYSIVLLLGASPRTATELGELLSLSKGTVSHHVHILREAGLVTRVLEGSTMMLQLNRSTLEQLSAEALRAIDSGARVGTRSRKKAAR
jgi:ArsR family transcriptional regulator, arsenate/arsenite/antimonite-responsive transcriptional repressor